jgi:hypothetical protein
MISDIDTFYSLSIYVFVGLGILAMLAIPGWFVVDIIKRRRLGLPVLETGGPASLAVLYQPDEVLRARISLDALSVFVSAMQHKCLPALASSIRHPFDVVVGIKPGLKARVWIVPSGPTRQATKFQRAFDSIFIPEVTAPVAVALCVGRAPNHPPPLPDEWRRVLATKQGPTLIPDDVFRQIWNDDASA